MPVFGRWATLGDVNDSGQASFLDIVDLTAGSAPDEYIGPVSPERSGRTFGGQLLAQAIAAAYRSVGDDRHVHSIHALFLRAGEVDKPTIWQVEQVRDGRSFATRAATGFQDGREVLRLMASFHVPEEGLAYEPELDFDLAAIPPPEEVAMTYVDFCHAHPDVEASEWSGQDRPIDIRYIDAPDPAGGPPDLRPQRTWIRMTGGLDQQLATHYAALAYLADATLVDHVTLPHGYRWHDDRLTGTSLDHAMWFRLPPKADEWLLYDQRVESTGGARGLATGRFYDRSGRLLAGCTQEGLMRWAGGSS